MFVKLLAMSFSNVFVSFWCLSVLEVIDIKMWFKGGNKKKGVKGPWQCDRAMLWSSAPRLEPKTDTIEHICARAHEATIERKDHVSPNPSAIA